MKTWLGLRARSRGRVESAAIWGGKREGQREIAEEVYFLDDLKGKFQLRGYHRVSEEALAELFKRLGRERRLIVGDIHTHPTKWVGLSEIDRDHPIEFRIGLCALVLPLYAKPEPDLHSSGVHRYLGNGAWHSLSHAEKDKFLTLTKDEYFTN